jgi:transposase
MQERYKQLRVPADVLSIAILGGLLVMMGQHDRSESLFYYFRLEDHVPENHLLRLIDRHVSLDFIREELRDSYSDTGRPSIDPEVLLRILLIGYLYGVTSERKLVEELRMHLAWRWFTGLGFDQEIPNHSTLLEEPARKVPGVEPVSGAVRAHRRAVRAGWAGERTAHVGRR